MKISGRWRKKSYFKLPAIFCPWSVKTNKKCKISCETFNLVSINLFLPLILKRYHPLTFTQSIHSPAEGKISGWFITDCKIYFVNALIVRCDPLIDTRIKSTRANVRLVRCLGAFFPTSHCLLLSHTLPIFIIMHQSAPRVYTSERPLLGIAQANFHKLVPLSSST